MPDTVPRLDGDRVRLRPFDRADVTERLALGRSAEIVRGFGGDAQGMPPYGRSDARRWVERNLAHPLAWAIELEGRLLGEIRLDGADAHERRARLAVGLYDVAELGQGLGREAIRLVLSHAFGPLGLHRVGLRVIATNERAIRCYRACGFVEEGRERESARVGGRWHDDVIMGLLARDYRADTRATRGPGSEVLPEAGASACIFCAMASGEAPAHVLARDADALAILSLEGHPLVLPRRHASSLSDLDDRAAGAIACMATHIARALRAESACEGVNLVLSDGAAAGQDVPHLHLHVKPRWPGDGVVLRWDTATRPAAERARLAEALLDRLDGTLTR